MHEANEALERLVYPDAGLGGRALAELQAELAAERLLLGEGNVGGGREVDLVAYDRNARENV